MERLPALIVLEATRCEPAHKTFPALEACTQLRRICVVDVQLNGFGAGASCPSVRELELSRLPLLRDLAAPIARFAGLRALVLEELEMEHLPAALGDLPLHRLQIRHCRWLRALPKSLARLSALSVLHVVGRPLDRATHAMW